jgi:quercetin dioxygenase-like cupin family protein
MLCIVRVSLYIQLQFSDDDDIYMRAAMRMNGFPCKREANVTADDFFFDGLASAGDVYSDNPAGSAVTAADAGTVPGLNTLGVSMARADYAPWGGAHPPHAHPRATEMLFVVEGALEVGFVTGGGRLLNRTLSRGEVFVFPRGLVHFQRCVGGDPAVSVSAFNSQSPGTQVVGDALFGADPAVPTDVLVRAFRVDAGVVESIKSKFQARTR